MEQSAFSVLFALREKDAQGFSQLLHDDAGQMLTAIALRLSALEVPDAARAEIIELQVYLDELLDRFRLAQNALGSAVIPRKGLAAALSHWRRLRGDLEIRGKEWPSWPTASATACFRIVENLEPALLDTSSEGLVLHPRKELDVYVEAIAAYGELSLHADAAARTIKITHANTHTCR